MVIGTMAGYVLAICFVACVAVVLSAIADVVRENEQGARPMVSVSYVGRPLPASLRRPAETPRRGRHRA